MTEPTPNILGNLFGGMEDLGKLAESQKKPELDKLKPELDKLKKEVDVQKLRQAVEQGDEVEIVAVLNPLEKLFKEVECPEAGFTDPDEISAKWLIMKERIVNWLIEEREKKARQPIDEFLNDVSTLTDFPVKKEEANEFAQKLKDTLEPKKLIFGSIIAGLIKEADKMRAEDGSDSLFGSILRSIADLLSGKDRKKIDALTSEMTAAIKEKNWGLVEEKANALLKEDKDNKKAKDALALAGKKKTTPTKNKKETAPETPGYEKKIAELNVIVKSAGIPVAIDKKEYQEVLKRIPGDDPNALKQVVEKGSQERGGVWTLNQELQNHPTLKDDGFKLMLSDYLIPTAALAKAAKTLAGLPESPYELPEDVTPNQLRDFLTALEKEEGLGQYKKKEEDYQADIPRTPSSADI